MQVGSSTSKSSIRVNPPTKRWGEVAVDKGFITNEQLQDALEEQKRGQQTGNIELLGAVLIRQRVITREQAAAVDRAMQGTSQLAGFEILEKVGQGGMGAVFRARQISMDRIVALKILPRKLAQDPKAKERFFREARLCASMNHLNLINGIDCGEAGGYTFFAMEFVEGETARKVLKTKGKIPVKECVDIIRQISTALDYAHSKKLVHRDVKPENIMITPEGVAKLCDLGLSRSISNSDEDASLTQAGQAVGTPYYISPEQARGEEVDARTDIYSLGATFYHLLAGKPPFEGASAAVIMAKHLTDTAPPLSNYCSDLDDGYVSIVSKMMAKSKDDRYATLKEVMADLDTVERGGVPSAASFKASSSCPRPSSSGSPASAGRRTTGPTNPVMATADRAVRTTRSRSSSGSSSEASSGLLIGGGVAALVLVAILLMSGGGGGPSMKAAAPKRSEPAPAPAPVAAPVSRPQPPQGQPHMQPGHQMPPPGQRPPPNFNQRPNGDPIGMANSDPVGMVEPAKGAEDPLPTTMRPADNKPEDTTPEVKAAEAERMKPAVATPEVKPVEPKPAAIVRPALDLKSTVLRARFLAEMQRKTPKPDLPRMIKDARDLAAKPDYAPVKDALEQDIKDIEAMIKYEAALATAIGEAKPEIVLPKDHPLSKGPVKIEKVKVKEYANNKLTVTGAGFESPLQFHTMPPKDLIELAKLGDDAVPSAHYLFVRGDLEEAGKALDKMPEADRPALKEKLELIKTGELEMAAQTAYDAIQASAKSNQWKVVWEKIPAFTTQHGATHLATEKAEDLEKLKQKAEETLWPMQALFKTKSVKSLPDGFVEVTYDFSNKEQLKDFECQAGDLSLRDGKMCVPRGGEQAYARYLPKMIELRKIEVTGRTLLDDRDYMGMMLLEPGERLEWSNPML
ncbi:MAG TPA: protein kinase, partial [Planctomycetota bacterium]|nr:protein kinase [Planctomycetota bacterium]